MPSRVLSGALLTEEEAAGSLGAIVDAKIRAPLGEDVFLRLRSLSAPLSSRKTGPSCPTEHSQWCAVGQVDLAKDLNAELQQLDSGWRRSHLDLPLRYILSSPRSSMKQKLFIQSESSLRLLAVVRVL